MSKPIINGIDVSECGYYNKDNEPFCCEIWDNECEAQDCYFKQSKRLKQQIEAYQLSENEAKEIIAELKHKNKRLQGENEELKKFKKEILKPIVLPNIEEEVTNKYKQALEEIKEKLKKYDANIGDTIIANPIQDCYDTYKLINEALNDRD